MMQTNLIPAMDPNPLPAPYWVLKLLLIVTFFLHILAMNFMLGGGVLALVAKWGSKHQVNGNNMFFDIARKLPSLLPATVTLGIAPLLFLQVIYGQYFYASSIVIAWPWFLVLVMLCAAYYSFYFASYQSQRHHRRASGAMLFSMILVLIIGFVYSNNMTLSEVPSRWRVKYFANPSGWNLNLTEPTLIPRFLHFMVAAVAMGGLLLVFMAAANWKRNPDYARKLLQFGAKAFTYGTMAQLVVGLWLLISIPASLRMLFMGANPLATGLLLVGIVGGVGSIFMMANARRTENIHMATWYVPGVTAVVILCMTWMRDILRDAYLKPYFHPEQFVVKTQWAVLPLFLVLFIAGVAFWFLMLKRYGLIGGGKTAGAVTAIDSKA